MTRSGLLHIIEGTHPQYGRGVALGLNALILASALAISIETMPGLPAGVQRLLYGFEIVVLAVFSLEYLLRLTCSPRPLRYMFSFWGLVDLLAILPALALLQPQWAAVRTFRLIRLVRLLKLFRTSRALDRLVRALASVRAELIVLGVMAGIALYVSAVAIYIFEHRAQPEMFSSIPASLWWAVVSLTTVGYGDMVPITLGGRIFASMVLFVGLGVVAGPAAIITKALLETEIESIKDEVLNEDPEETEFNTEDVT